MTNRRYIIASVLVLMALTGAAGLCAAQTQQADTVSSLPGIEITTSVDKAEVYIGDLIAYTVSITYDTTKYTLIPPPLGANLGAFDVKDYQPDVETRLSDGRVNSKTTFKLSTFTTGDYTIPPLPVLFRLPDSTVKILLAEPVPIKVKSLLAEAGDSVDIRPLKEPYAFPRDYTPFILWGGGGVLVLVLAFLVWLFLRRRKKAEEQVDLREPWEIAFERLALLDARKLPAEQRYKEYYIELTEILRDFLGRVYEVDVLEMTTEEFLECFVTITLPAEVYNEAAALLKHADLVKFARFVPEAERAEKDFKVVHNIIETVRQDVMSKRAEQEQMAAVAEEETGGEEYV
ncbi:MAG: hypothetical protein D6800_04275 [Candidatus Zixiibacteriota bacterium]|nr:MAG: hypothetical protein D6800_04275 [candidate division Zixibacteria bacterium]